METREFFVQKSVDGYRSQPDILDIRQEHKTLPI